MDILQIAALFYLVIYYGVLLGLRSYLLYKKTGINPIRNMEKVGVEGFIEKVFTVCFVLVAVIVLNFVFLEANYLWLVPITYLELPVVGYVGVILSGIGLTIGIIAQLQMGDAWRLGLNKAESTTLITRGFYQYSRNPIYLGLMISNVGFFMMMPNALSFAFLVVSYFALEVKIRLEEQYLDEVQGEEYIKYKQSVHRLI